MGEHRTELFPVPFWATTPPDGTLVTGVDNATPGTTYASPRDRYHVFPFLVKKPPVGTRWRLDTIWIQNISLSGATVYVSVSVANINLTRPASSSFQLWGTAIQPATHFAFGLPLAAGQTEAIDTGGVLVHGGFTGDTSVAMGLWAGAYPGSNPNAIGVGNDGVNPGAVVSFNGVVLT